LRKLKRYRFGKVDSGNLFDKITCPTPTAINYWAYFEMKKRGGLGEIDIDF